MAAGVDEDSWSGMLVGESACMLVIQSTQIDRLVCQSTQVDRLVCW